MTTPPSSIRGPEITQPTLIASAIASQDHATLSSYTQGLRAVIQAWQLLKTAHRLAQLRSERTFLIAQLEILEARDPHAVAAALTQPTPTDPPPSEPGESDPLLAELAQLTELLDT